MSQKTGEKKSGLRRRLMEKEILDQAVSLFAERGVAGTTLQDVADALGISRPALYYYVKSKDALLERLIESLSLRDAQDLESIRRKRGLSPSEKLHAMASSMVTNAASQPEKSRILSLNRNQLPEEIAKEERAAERSVRRSFQAVIEDGMEAGEFRAVDGRTASFAIIGMCIWTAWWVDDTSEQALRKLSEQIADHAVASVLRADRVEGARDAAGLIKRLREDLDQLERVVET